LVELFLYMYCEQTQKKWNKMHKVHRNKLKQASKTKYDLIIIGGGITGAGIALDAASRGISTLLVEKKDFASGTSSKSTKLIHGGLRYLKQLEFKLVADVGKERAVVHHIAPNLVHPMKMILPFTKTGKLGKVSTFMALTAYDWLANVEGADKKQMLSVEEAKEVEPLLKDLNIKGAGYYAEYRTDDARLTIEVIKKAQEKGATCINYCEVTEFIQSGKKVEGVEVIDHLSNQKFSFKANQIVNATGPWVDTLRKKVETIKGKRLQLTKGVHIVIPFDEFPVKQPVYFDTSDERMIFAIPRLGVTYIGTTDTVYTKNMDEVYATKEDVDYITDQVHTYFGKTFIKKSNIQSTWAGLRPLIYEDGKDPSELSRKDEIFHSKNGLLSIAGGKLTGYRTMSQRIVDIVAKRLDNSKECRTEKIKLGKEPFKNYKEVKKYIKSISKKLPSSLDQKLEAEYLVSNYGKDAAYILKKSSSFNISDAVNLLLSELNYVIKNEMVMTSADFWIRRTGRIYFRIDTVNAFLEIVNERLNSIFDWTNEQKEVDLKEIKSELQKTIEFKNS